MNNDTPSPGDLPGLSATDIDPRFDDAAAGTAPPRAGDAPSAQVPRAEVGAAAIGWVRARPMQALSLALGVGYLLGRSGR